jgi:hypothetical protein
LGCLFDRLADANIGVASANVAGHSHVDVSVRLGLIASKADADMIWPDWQ